MAELTNEPFRQRLKAARELARLNISELARRLRVSPQAAHAWETGTNTPRPKRVEQIANVLGVNAAWLAWGTEDTTHTPARHKLPERPPVTLPTTTKDVAAAWLAAWRAALPDALRPYLDQAPPPPWPKLDYFSPTLACCVVKVTGQVHNVLLDRAIRKLLLIERLGRITGQSRTLLLILADSEAVQHHDLSAQNAWELTTLGIDAQSVATPEDAALALLQAEVPA